MKLWRHACVGPFDDDADKSAGGHPRQGSVGEVAEDVLGFAGFETSGVDFDHKFASLRLSRMPVRSSWGAFMGRA